MRRTMTDFVSHIRHKFMEVGHRLIDINHMCPVALDYIGFPSPSGSR